MSGVTLTSDSLAEVAAEIAADPSIEAAIFKFIPADTVKSLTKLIDNFADDPDRYANAFSKLSGNKEQTQAAHTVQTQTAPTRKNPRKVINADFIDGTEKPETETPEEIDENEDDMDSKFEFFYYNIVSELETAISLIGDLPLSAIIDQLKNNPDTCKPLLKPHFELWMA